MSKREREIEREREREKKQIGYWVAVGEGKEV